MGKAGHLRSLLRLGCFRDIGEGTGTIRVGISGLNRGRFVLGLRHRHYHRFEIAGWVGDEGRGLCLLREPARLAYRILGNMVVRDIWILKIRLAAAGRRVMGRAEWKLCGRKG